MTKSRFHFAKDIYFQLRIGSGHVPATFRTGSKNFMDVDHVGSMPKPLKSTVLELNRAKSKFKIAKILAGELGRCLVLAKMLNSLGQPRPGWHGGPQI